MPNDELFIDVLAQIESDPDSWKQGDWRCDTGMCFAGWATELAGYRWHRSGGAWVAYPGDALAVHCSNVAWYALGVVADPLHYGAIADADTRYNLFAASNGLDDLYRISADILGVDPQVLRDKVQDRLAR